MSPAGGACQSAGSSPAGHSSHWSMTDSGQPGPQNVPSAAARTSSRVSSRASSAQTTDRNRPRLAAASVRPASRA